MANPIVSVHNVYKSYQRDSIEIPVLQNISFEVPGGEFLGLMGPSGSGKTTLLNLIAGIDKPNQGSIKVAGTEVTTMSESELAKWRAVHVGFIFQFYNLIPVLRRERRKHVETALTIVGLEDRMSHYPTQLSGGEEQRVAIARAIVTDPTILVADEPTGDLDKHSAEQILTLIDRLNKEFKKTIIMVTHDPRAAEKAHTIRHLDKGELT